MMVWPTEQTPKKTKSKRQQSIRHNNTTSLASWAAQRLARFNAKGRGRDRVSYEGIMNRRAAGRTASNHLTSIVGAHYTTHHFETSASLRRSISGIHASVRRTKKKKSRTTIY
jgi:hypothetical protein